MFQWPLGWLSDRFDRRLIILAGNLTGMAVAAVFFALLAGGHGVPTSVLAFILGGALMPLYSVCLAEVNDRIDGSEMIATASSFVLIYGVGSAVGPVAAGLVIGQAGPSGLFLFMAVTLGLFAAFDALHIRFWTQTATGDKRGYVPTPCTSHAVLPLHAHCPDQADGEAAPA